jgi:RimJ/RimL family protein N-acetyltransferase
MALTSTDAAAAQPKPGAWQSIRQQLRRWWRDRVRPQWGVPMRVLAVRHRERMVTHLLALSASDRYLRFGYAANDEQIKHYVAGINFGHDQVLGIFDRRLQLLAVAHLAQASDPKFQSCAEFGVSVRISARGRGYGGLLFGRCITLARNHGVSLLFIHALTENTAMLNIARKAGAVVERHGSESEAHLQLPPANLRSRVREHIEQRAALANYQLKAQASQFWRVLRTVQEIRQGVRQAKRGRHR